MADMDEGTPTIRLAAGSDYVSIAMHEPYGSMADEREATVVVGSGTFHGEVAGIIWISEIHTLRRLLSELESKVGQTAHADWETLEGKLDLSFDLSRIGHLLVHVDLVDLRDGPMLDTLLRFSIRADQTYLSAWIRQIAGVLDSLNVSA